MWNKLEHFELVSNYKPTGDQPQAINELTEGLIHNEKYQTLLGITGSGKTFTMANVIKNVNKPCLILSHNKTLSAQLYGEMKQLFPHNAVEYFVSYYDYYQPEAYNPVTDIHIDKDVDINEQIDRLRLKATMSLMERRDVIIIASVSCIYGLGIPKDYRSALIYLKVGQEIKRDDLLYKLVDIYYSRNDIEFQRGTFRVRGDTLEIYPAYLEHSIRVEFFGDKIESLSRINPLTCEVLEKLDEYSVYPARHFVISPDRLQNAIETIKDELNDRIRYFIQHNKLLEAQRIEQRTNFDLEMLQQVGYVSGIENYSRHLSGRKPGERSYCLLDYFPDDYLTFIDESHVTIPQLKAMYKGDYSRKHNLIEYGFRLPSAYDNRPLRFDEFEKLINQVIFVSATPGDYELKKCNGVVTEQLIRPTGLIDPDISVNPIDTQIDHLLEQIRQRVEKHQRVLVSTLTKKMAEDLTEYIGQTGQKVQYLHSDIDTIDRVKIIRQLRLGEIDIIVGVNLLREGLDLPEVSLVAILDADKAGFLRSEKSLIQIAGRAARNIDGQVIFYADKITDAMQKAIDETRRRRQLQFEYNKAHNITPQSIQKTIDSIMLSTLVADSEKESKVAEKKIDFKAYVNIENKEDIIKLLTKEMQKAARELEFEKAADIRDRILELKEM